METSNAPKLTMAGWNALGSQISPSFIRVCSSTVSNAQLNAENRPLSDANMLGEQLKHAARSIQASEMDEIMQGSSASDKSISNLLQEHISEVNQPIWVNLFNTVYHSQISKKQAVFLIKSLDEFVRNYTDSDPQSKDFHRLQRKAILIGYTMLAILELQILKDEGYISPHQKYFLGLEEKDLIRESVKIGAYISKMIEQSQKTQGGTSNSKADSLFTKYVEGLVGDGRSERRTMLTDWASMERMNKFSTAMESFVEQPVSKKPQHQIQGKQSTSQNNVALPTLCKHIKQGVKQPVIVQQFPEYEKTSCNQSVASEPNSLQTLKSDLRECLVPVYQENLGPVAEFKANTSQRDPQLEEDHINNVNVNEEERNQQPQQQVLCSTADTSNFYPQPFNLDNLPPIPVVFENDDERQELTEVITPLSQVINPPAEEIVKQSIQTFGKEQHSDKAQRGDSIEECFQKNEPFADLLPKASSIEDKSLSFEYESLLLIADSSQPEITEKAVATEFQDNCDQCISSNEKQEPLKETYIFAPNEQTSKKIELSESELQGEMQESQRPSVPKEAFEIPLETETLSNNDV